MCKIVSGKLLNYPQNSAWYSLMTAGEGGSGGRGFVYNYDRFQLLYGRNQAFSDGSAVKKNPPANAGDMGSFPGL